MSDYTFPVPEHQWDYVDSGSSASDLHPSVLFSIVKRNKAKKPYCQDGFFILDSSKNFKLQCYSETNMGLFPYISSSRMIHNIGKMDSHFTNQFYPNVIWNKIGIMDHNLVCRYISYFKNTLTSICHNWNNSNKLFQYNILPIPYYGLIHDSKISMNKIMDCSLQNINTEFKFSKTDNTEWCSSITYEILKTGFSGCRSENIGFKSLPDQFGTKFMAMVSCNHILWADKSIITKSSKQDTNANPKIVMNSEINPLKSFNYDPLVSRMCFRPGFTVVPSLTYGRINAMINIPVIRTTGRING